MIICKSCKNYIEDSFLSCDQCKELTDLYSANSANLKYEDGRDIQLKPVHSMAIRMLQMQLKRLEKEMKETFKNGKYSEYYTKQLKELTYTIEKLIKEGRALEREQKNRVDNMTLNDKLQIFLRFVSSLPPEMKAEVQQAVFRIVNGKAEGGNQKL